MTLDFFDLFWVRLAFGLVFGGVLGSFAGVLAYRLPRGLSIVAPRSHCLSCNATLGIPDLVPIFSWLVLRGRCRHCGEKIGAASFLIEAAVSLACAAATVVLGFSFWLIPAYAGIVGGVVLGASIKARF
jgi:prepilin signal peptidase PulO-like enzyme (type II secretory pathway)